MPDRAIAGVSDRGLGELRLGRFQLLKTYRVGLRLIQPIEQDLKPAVDAIDVEGGEFQGVVSVA